MADNRGGRRREHTHTHTHTQTQTHTGSTHPSLKSESSRCLLNFYTFVFSLLPSLVRLDFLPSSLLFFLQTQQPGAEQTAPTHKEGKEASNVGVEEKRRKKNTILPLPCSIKRWRWWWRRGGRERKTVLIDSWGVNPPGSGSRRGEGGSQRTGISDREEVETGGARVESRQWWRKERSFLSGDSCCVREPT